MLMASSTNNPIATAAAGVEFSIGVTYQGQVLAWGSPEFGQVIAWSGRGQGLHTRDRCQLGGRLGLDR